MLSGWAMKELPGSLGGPSYRAAPILVLPWLTTEMRGSSSPTSGHAPGRRGGRPLTGARRALASARMPSSGRTRYRFAEFTLSPARRSCGGGDGRWPSSRATSTCWCCRRAARGGAPPAEISTACGRTWSSPTGPLPGHPTARRTLGRRASVLHPDRLQARLPVRVPGRRGGGRRLDATARRLPRIPPGRLLHRPLLRPRAPPRPAARTRCAATPPRSCHTVARRALRWLEPPAGHAGPGPPPRSAGTGGRGRCRSSRLPRPTAWRPRAPALRGARLAGSRWLQPPSAALSRALGRVSGPGHGRVGGSTEPPPRGARPRGAASRGGAAGRLRARRRGGAPPDRWRVAALAGLGAAAALAGSCPPRRLLPGRSASASTARGRRRFDGLCIGAGPASARTRHPRMVDGAAGAPPRPPRHGGGTARLVRPLRCALSAAEGLGR